MKEFESIISADKKYIGWLCSYTPLELIYATGFLSYRIIGHSEPPQNANSYIHPNFCQFVKTTIDVAIEGGYDERNNARGQIMTRMEAFLEMLSN